MDYYLADNPLTTDPNDFRGVVITNGTKTRADIVASILKDNNRLSEADILAVFHAEKNIVCEFMEEGYGVKTELFYVSPNMRGVFHNIQETFNPEKHELRLKFTSSKVLREAIKRITLRKVAANNPSPQISLVEDVVSGTNNEKLTPGKSARIFGDKLTFDHQDVEQGVFLINKAGKVARVNEYIDKGSKRIYVGLPDILVTGTYTLQVKAKTQGGEVRTGQLDTLLAVE
uniref:DNA-binding domain-containing protein n=1 Tax=Roseihalotalea indica TaxID=2867963 RepID=A0AA49GTY0_9BACT|nr:DNA-binding domain-containing protein [Tunicatimonas sp. TK19036]